MVAKRTSNSVVKKANRNVLRPAKVWHALHRRFSLWLSYRRSPQSQLFFKQISIDGLKLLVPSNEDVGRVIAYLGIYEPEETNYLLSALRPDDICFDVGANLGYYTSIMARIVKRGRVHAFDPDPMCRALLELNVRLNGFENVSIQEIALGARSGRVQLIRSADSGFNSLRDTDRRPVLGALDVASSTIDTYMEGQRIERIDVLKVDVEGAEALVIEGASQLLSDPSRRPRLILMELFDQNLRPFGAEIGEITTALGLNGYKPFVMSEGRAIEYTPTLYNRFYNVFFKC